MAGILQTTFSNAFSRRNVLVFLFIFLLKCPYEIGDISSFGQVMIIQMTHWHKNASPGINELKWNKL